MTGGAEGLLHGGGLARFGKQAVAVVVVAAYAGLDLTVHAETAYDHGVLGHGAPVDSSLSSAVPTAQKVKKQA